MTGQRSTAIVLVAAIWLVGFTRSGGWGLLFAAVSGNLWVKE